MCLYVHVWIHTRMHKCKHVYVCIYVRVHVCMYVYMHTYMHECMCMHMYVCACTHVCIYNTLHYTAPHCAILQHTAPHCTTLHHTAPRCTARHHAAPHCTTRHHTAPHSTTEYHPTPHWTTPHHTARHGTILHHITHVAPHCLTPFQIHLGMRWIWVPPENSTRQIYWCHIKTDCNVFSRTRDCTNYSGGQGVCIKRAPYLLPDTQCFLYKVFRWIGCVYQKSPLSSTRHTMYSFQRDPPIFSSTRDCTDYSSGQGVCILFIELPLYS